MDIDINDVGRTLGDHGVASSYQWFPDLLVTVDAKAQQLVSP